MTVRLSERSPSVSHLDLATLERLSARAPADIARRRREAYKAFSETAMPTAKDEAWRYVDLDLDLDTLTIPDAPGSPLEDDEFVRAVAVDAIRVDIIDGFVSESAGTRAVEIEIIPGPEGWLADAIPATLDKLAAASRAFATETLAVRVPAGVTIDQPILIDLQVTRPGSISFPSVAVTVDEGAEATLVMVARGGDESAVIPRVALDVGAGGRLRFTTVQELGETATSITHQRGRVGRDATLMLGEVGLGGQFARLDLGIELAGQGGSADVVGLYFGEREQVLDYRMVIQHVGPHTSSNVFLKGAVEDEARSVFTGLLRIEKGANRSSAFETNRNLVLSAGAKAHSVPNLEILCNEVVCGHASSVGPLDDEHLYYLMSRGLSRARAERVLIKGFFGEVIKRLQTPQVAEPIRQVVDRRFVEAQAAGRLAGPQGRAG